MRSALSARWDAAEFRRSGNSVVPHQTKKRADVDFTNRKRPGVRSANRSDHEEAPTRVNRGFFGLTGTDHWGQSIQSVPISSWLVGSKGTIRPSSLLLCSARDFPGSQGHDHRPQHHKARGRCSGVQVVPVLFGPPHWLDCGWGAAGTASTRTPKHRRSLREAVAIRRRPRATITSLNFGQRVVGRQR